MNAYPFYDQIRKFSFKSYAIKLPRHIVEFLISEDFEIPEKYINERMRLDADE